MANFTDAVLGLSPELFLNLDEPNGSTSATDETGNWSASLSTTNVTAGSVVTFIRSQFSRSIFINGLNTQAPCQISNFNAVLGNNARTAVSIINPILGILAGIYGYGNNINPAPQYFGLGHRSTGELFTYVAKSQNVGAGQRVVTTGKLISDWNVVFHAYDGTDIHYHVYGPDRQLIFNEAGPIGETLDTNQAGQSLRVGSIIDTIPAIYNMVGLMDAFMFFARVLNSAERQEILDSIVPENLGKAWWRGNLTGHGYA